MELPTELLMKIINHVRDKKTLLALRLTNKLLYTNLKTLHYKDKYSNYRIVIDNDKILSFRDNKLYKEIYIYKGYYEYKEYFKHHKKIHVINKPLQIKKITSFTSHMETITYNVLTNTEKKNIVYFNQFCIIN